MVEEYSDTMVCFVVFNENFFLLHAGGFNKFGYYKQSVSTKDEAILTVLFFNVFKKASALSKIRLTNEHLEKVVT
jgi:hypothetical protein